MFVTFGETNFYDYKPKFMSPTGHFAIGFASKKYATKLNIFLLLFASFFIDVVYFVSDALGGEIEGELSYSHSFLAAILFSIIFYAFTVMFTRSHKLSYVLALVVFSHWVLDFLVWDNLSWLPRSAQNLGLGFYNWLGIDTSNPQLNGPTIFVTLLELSMLAVGVIMYIRARKQSKKLAASV